MTMKTKTDNWSDLLNPVFIKEMRQFFHNKLFLSVTVVLLVVQLLLVSCFNSVFREADSLAAKVFITVDTWVMYLCVFAKHF